MISNIFLMVSQDQKCLVQFLRPKPPWCFHADSVANDSYKIIPFPDTAKLNTTVTITLNYMLILFLSVPRRQELALK